MQSTASVPKHIFVPKAELRWLDPASFAERYVHRIDQYRDRWDVDLREHLAGEVPNIDGTERNVERSLGRAG